MSARSAFHDRALIALRGVRPVLSSVELGAAMQLADPSSVIAELLQMQLLECAGVDRTARPWLWRWRLTSAGHAEAIGALERAAADRRRLALRLERADRGASA